MRKGLYLFASICALSACSTPVQQSSVPMDMQSVIQYQQRVQQADKTQADNEWELNQSDKRPTKVIVHSQPVISPSMYYGWGNSGYYGHSSGVGLRIGY